MKSRSMASSLVRLAFIPILAAATGVAIAQGPPRGYDHHDDHHDDRYADRHDDHRGGPGNDFHFRDEDRGHFESHYHRDIDHWRHRPDHRPAFMRGQRIDIHYHFQPVPRAYYREVPPPPPGYQYGYYQGYVVAYDPTTRIVADVIDLVAAASSR